MSYIIDGHNLVPKLGLRLSDPQDEMQLIERVQEFCRLEQTLAEVFFDGAEPGQPSQRKVGRVTAHFIRKGSSADAAIEERLRKLGRSARNWKVVSSDHRVQASTREAHAKVISSEAFAKQVKQAEEQSEIKGETDAELSQQAVDEWMILFKNRKKEL